ncbi:MAG: gliding motility-associated C-terminal domain-containing protein [Flavobacteriales bacterium]
MNLLIARTSLCIALATWVTSLHASATDAVKGVGNGPDRRVVGESPTVVVTPNNISCNGADDGSVDALVTGGQGPYSFIWSNGAVTEDITGLPPGTYSLLVTDANGLTATATATVVEPDPLIAEIVSIVDVLCFGGTTGGAMGEVYGGTPPYQYLWNSTPNSTTTTIAAQNAGTYVFNATDANGCTAATAATIAQPSSPLDAFVESMGMVSCFGGQDGNVIVGITGGSGSYNVVWNTTPVQTGASISGLPAGNYLAEITDQNGCSEPKFLPVTITGPDAALLIELDALVYNGGFNTSCPNSEDAGIDATISGGTQPYSITWSGPGGAQFFTEDLFNLAPGTYAITVMDGNGCTATSAISLMAPPALTATSLIAPGTCQDPLTGAMDITAMGGVAPYSFTWTGPNGYLSSSEDIAGLAPGEYALVITDMNGCIGQHAYTLPPPGSLSASATIFEHPGGTGTSCAGALDGSVDLTINGGMPPYMVLWTGPNGFSSDSFDLEELASGTYTASILDALGCTTSVTVTLISPPPLEVQGTLSAYIGGGQVSCHNALDGSIDITVTGGIGDHLYAWTGSGALAATTQDVGGLGAGTYTVEVSDLNGCRSEATYTLTAPAPLDAVATIVNSDCQGAANGSIDLTISGGNGPYSVFWTSGLGLFSSNSEDLQDLFAGVYTVTITDANGCSLQRSFNVDGTDQFIINGDLTTYAGGYNISCAGVADGGIEVAVTGGVQPYTYTWFTPIGVVGNTATLSDLPVGTYELIVTDQNGCSGLAVFELTGPQPLTIGLLPAQYVGGINVTCPEASNGSIDATVLGGMAPYTFLWSAPDGSTFDGEDPTDLAAGQYALTITDVTGCSASTSITLYAPDTLAASIIPTVAQLACAGDSTAVLELAINGGTGPYAVQWSSSNGTASTSEIIAGITAGSYSAQVVDLHGCTAIAFAHVTAPEPIVIDLSVSTYPDGSNLPCHGSSAGSITAVVTGGVPNFSYTWSGPGGMSTTTPSWEGLPAGSYSLAVTDANGCTSSAQLDLQEPTPLSLVAVVSDAGNGYEISCLGNDGSIDASITGGAAPYTTMWNASTGDTFSTEDISELPPGTYTLQVTDANGCVASLQRTLTAPEAIVTTFSSSDVICAGGSEGSIDLTVSGGTGVLTYSWTGPEGYTASTQDISGLVAGIYSVVISDEADCDAGASVGIGVSGAMSLSPLLSGNGAFNIPCTGAASGTIAITVSGGTAPVGIAWNGPEGFTSDQFELTGLLAGTYSFTLTDVNGCTKDSTITLTQPELALGATATASIQPGGTNIACHGGSDGSLHATASGGVGPYGYTWTGPGTAVFQGPSITGLAAGDYGLVVLDANGCSTALTTTLTEPSAPLSGSTTVSDFGGSSVSCHDNADGSIGVMVSGGTPGYVLNWTGPNGFASQSDSINGLPAGTYTILITDLNGCSIELSEDLTAPAPIENTAVIGEHAGGTAISCANASDGSIALSAFGGTSPLSVSWSGPNDYAASGTSISGLAAGTYCATIADMNGCVSDACFTLEAPEALIATTTTSAASCGNAVGAVDLTVTGGTLPYTHNWSNGSSSEDLQGLTPGTYAVTVTDANGCSSSTSVEVIGTAGLSGNLLAFTPLCQGGSNGSITASLSDGQAPFTYAWSNGGTQPALNDLEAGTYAVTVTDANGCTWTGSTQLMDPEALLVNSSVSEYMGGYGISSHGGSDGFISLTASGGVAPYAYDWSMGANSAVATGLSAGEYRVTVTDSNGCSVTLSFVLNEPDELQQPTGFTPNDDGANDSYVVRGLEAHPQNHLTIFNRWGNVVFERINYRNDWNGENMTGEPLPNGTYFVVLTIPAIDLTLQNYVDLRR